MTEKLITTFIPLDDTGIAKQIKAKEEYKKKFTFDADSLEAELETFNKREDPLINPATGNVMCLVRQPTLVELKSFAPPELRIYKKQEDIPEEVLAKYNDLIFDIMALLITQPLRTAQVWKEKAGIDFIKLFQSHLDSIVTNLEKKTDSFR
jgi:hypothetical protein